jgi:nitroimidazol reductase NimA-like FMN-containing flavoprotein (pyridoxamine 5'-phosphate oxidase superfamily)
MAAVPRTCRRPPVGFVMIGGAMDPTAGRPDMPGYGITGSDEGLLPFSWAEERLSEAMRYWVVTVSPGGAPHVMPVWAVWLDRCLWFSTGGRSRKARNLRADARCAVHTDGEDPVILHGTGEVVTEPDAIARLMDAYGRKYPDLPPDPTENPIVRVRPQSVFGLIEREFATSPTRWTF